MGPCTACHALTWNTQRARYLLVRVLHRNRTDEVNTYYKKDSLKWLRQVVQRWTPRKAGSQWLFSPRGWVSQKSQYGAKGLEDSWKASSFQPLLEVRRSRVPMGARARQMHSPAWCKGGQAKKSVLLDLVVSVARRFHPP